MSHVRQQIREAAAGLLAAAPVNWQRVFIQREAPLRVVLPYLLVYTPSESSTPLTLHNPFLLQRDLSLIVQAHVRIANAEEVEKVFDAVSVEIEQKITLTKLKAVAAKLTGVTLINTQTDIVISESNERLYGELTMTWQAQYHTVEGNPE